MVYRNLAVRLVLAVLVVVAVVAVGCSSGGKESDDPDPTPTPTPTNITGTVFLDQDANGVKGATETGIPNVVVSNGVTTTLTSASGGYSLPKEGDFVFVTVPKTHAASGAWYKSTSGTQADFGLKLAPEQNKEAESFTFIHMTDVHLDDDNLETFNEAIGEFEKMSPAFVVSTGDLVNEGDEKTISTAQATEWFGKYSVAISDLSMPVYNALGNHDCANLACGLESGAQAGCSKSAYRSSFGPTYYSFDWGQCHCVVLDPNEIESGSQVFEINSTQLAWLQSDLNHRTLGSPLLVFFHEPTTAWQSQNAVLSLLKKYSTAMFSGHAHQDLLMDSQGIPEQVTGALSGEWGHGDNPDGSKPGYRIVSVSGDKLESFYKEIGSTRQIQISPVGETWPIVNGQVGLEVKVFADNSTISGVTYSVDNATAVAMTLSAGSKWITAKATWDTASLTRDYHKIVVTATDNASTFQIEDEVKVSDTPTEPITAKELHDHLRVYQGHYVVIQGTVQQSQFNMPPFVPEGSGGAQIADSTGVILIYAGECYSPALPPITQGSTIKMRVMPMRFTWNFLASTQDREGTFNMMTMQEAQVPQGQKEDAGDTKVARWFMRLVTSSDVL